ncbi:uncharacterized protein LOC111692435 [Anoplophora glabripennis]|uniref:uncharacterized protein LOC111692435 n=1 Tax=Anoplophora glabripennis TaxID=217634 RepID=UPI000C782679|nr:uncharacterized protein LOC111692435 [Anoplophora glabripennis]
MTYIIIICYASHFEDRMFTSRLHTRLVATAYPTLFPSLEGSSKAGIDEHSYSAPLLLPAKIRVLDNRVLVPGVTQTDSADYQTEDQTLETETETEVQNEFSPVESPPLMSPTSTQTLASLTQNSPRKVKYRQNIKALQAENKYLRERVQVLESKLNNQLDNISLEQYMSLTFKFCNSVDTAKCINMQIAQGCKHPKDHSVQFRSDSVICVVIQTIQFRVEG